MNNKRLKKTVCLLIAVLMTLSFLGCKAKQEYTKISDSGFFLNTYITITLYDFEDESVIADCFEECSYYESIFSKTIAGSDIYNLNKNRKAEVCDETAELILLGIHYGELSSGAFDIGLGGVSELWDFTSGEAVLPDEKSVKKAVEQSGYRYIKIEDNTVSITKKGVQVDLGAIAKGYIADKIKELLISKGVTSATIDLGGNVLCLGEKPGSVPFNIGLRKPFASLDDLSAAVEINDASVVTSGIYERYFKLNDKIYHHILEPETGYPCENNLLSVTILSELSADGDALSTACFVLGLDEGMKLIDSIDGAYAIFITDDYNLHYSQGARENYEIREIQ